MNFLALPNGSDKLRETSLRKYHYTLHNIPEQRRFHPLHDGSPKSRIIKYLFVFKIFILPSVVLGRPGRSHHFLPASYAPVHGGGYKHCSLLRHNAVQSGGNLLMLGGKCKQNYLSLAECMEQNSFWQVSGQYQAYYRVHTNSPFVPVGSQVNTTRSTACHPSPLGTLLISSYQLRANLLHNRHLIIPGGIAADAWR